MLNWVYCVVFGVFCPNQAPLAITQYGLIEGVAYEGPDGFHAEMFFGIPYAKPPVGALRYEVGDF